MTNSTDGRYKKVFTLIINNFTFELKRKVLHIRPKLELAPRSYRLDNKFCSYVEQIMYVPKMLSLKIPFLLNGD